MQLPAWKPAEAAPTPRRFRERIKACAACQPSRAAPPWRSRLRVAPLALCGESGQVACHPFMIPLCTVIPYTSSPPRGSGPVIRADVEPLRLPAPLNQLPWEFAKDQVGPQRADFIGVMGALMVRAAKDQFRLGPY